MLTELELELLKSVELLMQQYTSHSTALQAVLRHFQSRLDTSIQAERVTTDQRIATLSNSLKELDTAISEQQTKSLDILMQTQVKWQGAQEQRLNALESLCNELAEHFDKLSDALIE